MSKKEKNKLIRIIIAGIMLAILMILEHMNIIPFMGIGNYNILELCLYMVPFLLRILFRSALSLFFMHKYFIVFFSGLYWDVKVLQYSM